MNFIVKFITIIVSNIFFLRGANLDIRFPSLEKITQITNLSSTIDGVGTNF